MSPLLPPALAPGDAVALVSPAGPVETAVLDAGRELLERRYRVVEGAAVRQQHGFLAGDDEARRADLRWALFEAEAGAVIASRGGYGTSRLIDGISLERLAARPRWIVGSSDLTSLLVTTWARLGLVGIHGPMAVGIGQAGDGPDLQLLQQLLEGRAPEPLAGLETLVPGRARGPLVGGNLTVLAHLCGALPRDWARGAVLFLEDVTEQPYRLDRCLCQLDRSGALDGLAAVVVGELTGCEPGPDGVTAREVVSRELGALGVPVLIGYPAAHGARNRPFLHGASVEIHAGPDDGSLQPG